MAAICPRCGYVPHPGRCTECDGQTHDVEAFGVALAACGLSPTPREAVALYYVVACNMTAHEAAACMFVSYKTVETLARNGGLRGDPYQRMSTVRHKLLMAYGAALARQRARARRAEREAA